MGGKWNWNWNWNWVCQNKRSIFVLGQMGEKV